MKQAAATRFEAGEAKLREGSFVDDLAMLAEAPAAGEEAPDRREAELAKRLRAALRRRDQPRRAA